MKVSEQIKSIDMKHSVSKKISNQVLAILIVASVILFSGSFLVVNKIVNENSEHYAKAILSAFADLLERDSREQNQPIDAEHTDLIQLYGDYVCKWYSVDYALVAVPNFENDTIQVLFASRKEPDDGADQVPFENHLQGMIADYHLNENEKAVWNGTQLFSTAYQNTVYGYECVTMMRIEDAFGHRLLVAVSSDYWDTFSQVIRTFSIFALIVLMVLFGVYFTVQMIVKVRVSKPAQKISQTMQSFVVGGKMSIDKLDDSGKDEFAMISGAFNNMTDRIRQYLDNIHVLTQEQEHQNTEVAIAAGIQNGLLPDRDYETAHYDIHALMQPAKNIGGDLYDYLPLDDHRTLLVMGDVSGKGIPAAIFMSVTLILIRQYAKLNLLPAEILHYTNDSLVEKNPAMLFATVFVGIYDRRTKQLVYANAGHDLPFIVNQSTVKPLKGKTGILLGLYPNETYPQSTCHLSVGETLFLYTDGVTETVNEQHQFFEAKRLADALSQAHAQKGINMVDMISQTLTTYAQGAEQHDDITMLAFTVKETKELLLNVDLQEIRKIRNAILSLPLSRDGCLDLCLAAEEWFDNICYYAYDGQPPAAEKVRFILSCSDKVVMRFESGGKAFDPIQSLNPPIDYDPDLQIGGLGNFIAFAGVDDVQYMYQNGKNVLTFTKQIEEKQNEDQYNQS